MITIKQFTARKSLFWRKEHVVVVIDELRERCEFLEEHANGYDSASCDL